VVRPAGRLLRMPAGASYCQALGRLPPPACHWAQGHVPARASGHCR